MKSLANDLLKVAGGIFKDISLAYPDIWDLSKDFDRLTRMVEYRGLGTFVLDLPAMDVHLVSGLRDGFLNCHGAFSKKVSKRVTVPKFLRGLWLKVFDNSGCLRDDPDTTAIFMLRQVFCLGKKVEVGCSTERFNNTLKEYHNVESEILRPTLRWDDDHLDLDDYVSTLDLSDLVSGHSWFGELVLWNGISVKEQFHLSKRRGLLRRLQRNADSFSRALGRFLPDSFSEAIAEERRGIGLRHGPGAVSDRKGEFDKYEFSEWPDKLESLFPFSSYGKLPSDDRERPRNHETYSELTAVPKTAKSPRLIACEPTEHQWCQQMIRLFLEERLCGLFGENFIAFKKQQLSQDMVRRASLDGHLATVDLSSASDRLSCYVVERIFRSNPDLLKALHAVRTRWGVDKISTSKQPLYFKYKKFASQGTAVTFPVQTIVFFLCAVTASGFVTDDEQDWLCNYSYQGRISRLRNQVRVFGDDIIIPNKGYDSLCLLLTDLGLKVNRDKSFATGLFRESCGSDCYNGDDVTPVKPGSLSAANPSARAALIDVSNNFFMKGLWHTSEAVRTIGERFFWNSLPITGPSDGCVGLKSYTGTSISHLKKRWNADLQKYDLRIWRFKSGSRREPTNTLCGVLQYFSEAPLPTTKWTHGIQQRTHTRDGIGWEPLF